MFFGNARLGKIAIGIRLGKIRGGMELMGNIGAKMPMLFTPTMMGFLEL